MKLAVSLRKNPLIALLLCLSVLILNACADPSMTASHAALPNTANETDDLHLGDSALNSGSLQMAASLYRKVLEKNPASLAATLGLGDVAYRSGDMERARLIYLQAGQLAPKQIEAKIGLARIEIRKRHLDEAIALYHQALAIQADNSTAAAGLGTALDLQGHHSAAQAIYRQALLAHPDAQSVRVDLGLSLILSQKAREGADILLDVANLPDAPAEARQNLALAFGVIGNLDAAKQILSLDLPPANVNDNLRFYAAVRKAYGENAAVEPSIKPSEPSAHAHPADLATP